MRIPFAPSKQTSVGVEWELQLVDLGTRELVPLGSAVLAEIGPQPKAKHELFECTVEVITGVCGTIAEAVADLRGTVEQVRAAAAGHHAGLMCAGTHPFSRWGDGDRISPDPRYGQIVERLQWLGRRLQIFGVHVHVGVTAKERAIPIVNALSAYLPYLLALSSSSPFWQGRDTGLASARTTIFEALPNSGLPPALADWAAFEQHVGMLVEAGVVKSIRDMWWDIRPHPDFGTVELRMFDGLPTYEEIASVAALAQCLVGRLDHDLARGYTLPIPNGWVLRENKWRAARYGLDADMIADDRSTVLPVVQAISDLVEELMPTARRLDCVDELSSVERVLSLGSSSSRQRAVAAAHGGDLVPVVDALLGELRNGLGK